jgi:hypothetical protein
MGICSLGLPVGDSAMGVLGLASRLGCLQLVRTCILYILVWGSVHTYIPSKFEVQEAHHSSLAQLDSAKDLTKLFAFQLTTITR